MRFYISADIEGLAGVVSRANLTPGGFEYEPARDWMTDAVISACATLQEGGASEVVVSDSHGNGQNIRFERMPPHVSLVRSWPRPLGMMQGIELGHYDGALLIGYHAGATALGGTLAHTVSGDLFQEIRLNGIAVSEAGISAAIAGHFGVPVLMVAGDDVAVDETRRLLGDIASACLKTSYGFMSAINPSPANADLRLREAVRDALALIGTVRPYTLTGPVVVDVKLRARFTAEWLSYLQDVEQRDAFTIRYPARDMVAVSRFIQFITSARAALS